MALCSKYSEGIIKLLKSVEAKKRIRFGDVPPQ